MGVYRPADISHSLALFVIQLYRQSDDIIVCKQCIISVQNKDVVAVTKCTTAGIPGNKRFALHIIVYDRPIIAQAQSLVMLVKLCCCPYDGLGDGQCPKQNIHIILCCWMSMLSGRMRKNSCVDYNYYTILLLYDEGRDINLRKWR